jgi:hypothetical protein|tara:strand:+ start:873 stop:1910 length:1038 start_codon:yes stop_codon:yes gene_type:complete
MIQNGYKKIPNPNFKKYNCDYCDYHTSNKKDFLKHCSTKKHDTKWIQENKGNYKYYSCSNCDYITCSKQKIEQHFNTFSHTNLSLEEGINKLPLEHMKKEFICEYCNKSYKYTSGLYRHSKKCIKKPASENNPELIKLLIESTENNNKLCEKLVALEAKQQIIQNTINQTINNNQKLNINLFLNNECKNAMNIGDFIDKIQLTLEDLMYSKQHGYIKGITNIFVKNLEDLEPTERPIHSIEDKKKRQFYVKDATGWECDKKEVKIDLAVDSVTKKQINKIKEWEATRPDWNNSDQGIEDYMKMIQTIMGGSNHQEREQNKKLIKKELTETFELNDTCSVIKVNND